MNLILARQLSRDKPKKKNYEEKKEGKEVNRIKKDFSCENQWLNELGAWHDVEWASLKISCISVLQTAPLEFRVLLFPVYQH